MVSSLAAACQSEGLAPIAVTTKSPRTRSEKETKKNGGFESCFASGLDLSEFGTNVANPTAPSAAAQLLKVKVRESANRKFHDQEQMRLKSLAEQRTHLLKEQASAARKGSGNQLVEMLGSMHKNDEVNQSKASREMKTKEKRLTKQYAKQMKVPPSKIIAKKRKRSKY